MNLKDERELIDILKENFPSMVVNYGDLQNAIIPSNFSSNNPLTKERRELLMNSLVNKMIECKNALGNPNSLTEAVYLLTVLRINQEDGLDWILTTELGDKPKDKEIDIPKVIIKKGDNKSVIKLNFSLVKDNPTSEGDDEIVHLNIKNIKTVENGYIAIGDIYNNLMNKFLITLNEGSIGDTVSYKRGDLANKNSVLGEALMKKFKEITSAFFLRIETLENFKPENIDAVQNVVEEPKKDEVKNGRPSQGTLFGR